MTTLLQVEKMTLDTKTLRRMWSFVETSNPQIIAKLSDEEIVARLTEQVGNMSPLNLNDSDVLSRYISARTPLIRDVAYSKMA